MKNDVIHPNQQNKKDPLYKRLKTLYVLYAFKDFQIYLAYIKSKENSRKIGEEECINHNSL